jgi:serine/threonine-protein phosphatase 6 regulatory subunit 3
MFPQGSDQGFMPSLSGFYIPRTLRSSTIDEALNKSDVKFEELLDNDDLLFELKNCNPKLMDYMTKSKENIKKLVEYIIVMPPDANDQKRAQKFPFTSCEIFESDLAPILNAFFTNGSNNNNNSQFDNSQSTHDNSTFPEENKSQQNNKEGGGGPNLLEYLFSFVDSNEPLNPVLCGYFNKLVQCLFKKNSRRLIEFVYDKKGLLFQMSKHIAQRSIAELLIIFLGYEAVHYDEKNMTFLELKLQVLDCLLSIFPKIEDSDEMNNIAWIIQDLIFRNEVVMDGREIMQKNRECGYSKNHVYAT